MLSITSLRVKPFGGEETTLGFQQATLYLYTQPRARWEVVVEKTTPLLPMWTSPVTLRMLTPQGNIVGRAVLHGTRTEEDGTRNTFFHGVRPLELP